MSTRSSALTGELGHGKTFAVQAILARSLLQRHSAPTSEAWTEDRAIVDSMTPKWSMDPLRGHDDPAEAALIAGKFYTTLLGCAPRERDGLTLNQVLRPTYLAEHDLHGSGDLLRHLAEDCEGE